MPATVLDVVLVIIAILSVRWLQQRPGQQYKHPPGPPGTPLLGNLWDMPSRDAWEVFRELGKKYKSDLVRLNIMGTNLIVVNSSSVATDLFDKRSAIYNDRQHMVMLNDLVGWGWALAFTPYNERWRDMRKAFHHDFNSEASKQFHEIETAAAREMVQRLAEKPLEFMSHARHLAGRNTMRTAYGIDIQEHDDPYIEYGEKAVHALSTTANAGTYLVDILPMLKYIPEWFPGASFKRQAKEWRPWVEGVLHVPFKQAKKQLEEGKAPVNCAATTLLQGLEDVTDPGSKQYEEMIIQTTLGSMYGGGADTTASAMGSFILAMVLHPKVQAKAQVEIDQVVGRSRLPTFADRPLLPYIDAILNETLRWRPVVRLSVPHRLTMDDVYNGYFMPKGSLVIGNCWAILRDEELYPEPELFNPDRFMRDGQLDPDVPNASIAAFGFGRRICPGRYIAYDSMWIAMASILATLHIKSAMDERGKLIVPREEYGQGLVAYPKPFAVDIRARSAEHAALVQSI